MRFQKDDIVRRHVALGILTLVFVGLLLGWTLVGTPVVWNWDGTWHIQKRVTEDYHTFYPEAEQIEYVSATSGGTPIAYSNVSLNKWLGQRCQDAATLFTGLKLMTAVNPLTVIDGTSYTVGSIDEPIRVEGYQIPDKTLLTATPDKVQCRVTFKGHGYSRSIPLEPIVDRQRPVSTLNGFTADTQCSTANEPQIDISQGTIRDGGTRDVTVSGVLMTDEVNYDYNAELVETGNRTRMLVISTDASRVQPAVGCIAKGAEAEESDHRTHFTANLSLNLHNVDTVYVYRNGQRVAGKQDMGAEHVALGDNDLPPIKNVTYWGNGTMHPLNAEDHYVDALHETIISAISHIHHVPVQGVYGNCTSSLRQSGVVEVTFREPVQYELDANGYPQSTTFSLSTTGQPLIFDSCTTPGATDSPVDSTLKWQDDLNRHLDEIR
jgi:hypothetical protein